MHYFRLHFPLLDCGFVSKFGFSASDFHPPLDATPPPDDLVPTMKFKLLAAAVLLALPSAALAQTSPAFLFKPWQESTRLDISADTTLYPHSHLDNSQSINFNLTSTEGRVRLTDAELPAAIGYAYTRISLSKNRYTPEHLDDASMAIGGPLAAADNWFFAMTAGGGYAGDNAFGDSNAAYAKASAHLGFELSNKDHFIVSLVYDGNATLFPDIPIPSIQTVGERHDDEIWFGLGGDLNFNVGFPYTHIAYKPPIDGRPLTLILDASFPDSIDVEARYQLAEPIFAFAKYTDTTYAFHVTPYPDTRRLFYDEQRVELGLTITPCPNASLTAAGGYAFSREFSKGFDTRDTDTLTDVSDEFYLRLGFELQF